MSLLDDIKAKADISGDGKLTKDDLESLKDGSNNDQIDQLKGVADQNGDNKLSLDDLKDFDLGQTFSDAKDTFGNLLK